MCVCLSVSVSVSVSVCVSVCVCARTLVHVCCFSIGGFIVTIHITIPVPSQVIVARTLNKKNAMMSVTTKVAMQLNCKLGGELWALEIPVSPISDNTYQYRP